MQYKCETCHDTGDKDKDSGELGYLNCPDCDAPMQRAALNRWLSSMRNLQKDDLAWAIHQRALAMAPKQEAPAQEPVAEIISGWQIVFVGAGPIAPIVEKHKLGIGAKLYAVGTVPPPEGWRDALQRLRDNTETFGQYSQETARVAIEGCIDALEELEPVTAPAAANGSLTDDQINTIWESLPGLKIVAGRPIDHWNSLLRHEFARAILAAAGPDAALVKALESALAIINNEADPDEYAAPLKAIRAALSGAKGN